ncbi:MULTISPECIES: cytochrome P450 [unclassified Streptomyces]|uniref:cytochrome P450 n=1 Tax=unclassified Streptomyces TaxID=2593676 RepID=UPI002E0F8792|nr:cytochrome P450 [Streptomyces sp. NBC_01197]WSS50556.1 cytochrome P450 [Streptomyces sp. NBC_01180]
MTRTAPPAGPPTHSACPTPLVRPPLLACPTLNEGGFGTALSGLTEPDGPALRPVTLAGGLRAWAATGAAVSRAVLTDPRLTNDISEVGRPVQGFPVRRYPEDFFAHAPQLLSASGDRHRRMRRIVAPFFTAAAAAGTAARLRCEAAQIIRSLAGRDRVDIVADLALPLAGATVGEVLGIPPERRRTAVTAALAASASAPGTEAARSAHRAFSRTVLQVISAARRHPTPTAATAVLHANRAGELTNAEMAGMLGMLLIGTIDSLATVIPAGTLLAMRCPDVGRGLSQRLGGGLGERPHHESVRGTGQTRALTEEILRLNPPFQHTGWRFTREPCRIAGISLPQGTVVIASLLSANLDPAVWPAPLRADPRRRAPSSHLSFGHGPHYCLGAALGRQLVHDALVGLFSRLPRLSLAAPADELTWHGSCLRRVNRLPVETHASALTG